MCTLLQSCCLSFLDFSHLFTAVENLSTYPEIRTMYRARHARACWRKSDRILAHPSSAIGTCRGKNRTGSRRWAIGKCPLHSEFFSPITCLLGTRYFLAFVV